MSTDTALRKRADQLAHDAWIGDAVLSLYARSRILSQDGRLDGEKCIRTTSNEFLSAVGEPTKVEAESGQVYQQDGLQAAFASTEERRARMRRVTRPRQRTYTSASTARPASFSSGAQSLVRS